MNNKTSLAISFLLSIGIFILDIHMPLGYAVYLLYVIPLFIAVSAMKSLYISHISYAYTILIMSGYFLAPSGGVPARAIFNRLMGTLALWTISLLLRKGKQDTEALERANQELKNRIDEKTSVNDMLQAEIAGRMKMEAQLRQLEADRDRLMAELGRRPCDKPALKKNSNT